MFMPNIYSRVVIYLSSIVILGLTPKMTRKIEINVNGKTGTGHHFPAACDKSHSKF